jgi:hypothetical protein
MGDMVEEAPASPLFPAGPGMQLFREYRVVALAFEVALSKLMASVVQIARKPQHLAGIFFGSSSTAPVDCDDSVPPPIDHHHHHHHSRRV